MSLRSLTSVLRAIASIFASVEIIMILFPHVNYSALIDSEFHTPTDY